MQGPIEVSHSRQERGVKEDKLDCYCINCRVYSIYMLRCLLTKLLWSIQE